jgi:RNA polymerase sigma-70 factor (ECF subfamily)
LLSTDAIKELQERIGMYEDLKAYETLYHAMFDPLRRFSFSIVKSNEAAEEIVSDVFIKLWLMRARLPEIGNLKVYLFTIAKNFSINFVYRNYKNISSSIDDIDVEPVVTFGNPEELFISAETIQKIKSAVRQLPPKCRLIFQLVKEEGMSYKEVAEIMELSVLTVRNQLTIAVKKIASQLPDSIKSSSLAVSRFSVS